ncbi:TCI1 [Cyberlindnera jadinii]|uniref:TCI1 protein n=1 Tax=Cyberlindnera jadinii (strain ATCC 18201 / CBS 1600 / BCRC 20928 / JCM 3617 / NBRC 0987 / NRRL Y-1542) TaxID=983966 RepID=A0A0H5C6G9_CYBJN|nr:TCI1 [Cyberlindnera jadinii]
MNLEELTEKCQDLIGKSDFQEAYKLLKRNQSPYQRDAQFLQLFGEVYLELGKVDKAYEKFTQAVELDPEGLHGGEKFLYLGQIIGGVKGLELIDRGVSVLSQDSKANLKRLTQGLFAEIEIWMTDLCMLPEAESKCDELITQCLELDSNNPETWSLMANIRISQQRDEEAIEAVNKSWILFKSKKEGLEKEPGFNVEYLELVQPLISLAKISIELSLFELTMDVLASIRDIDSDNVESYYLEGFANYLYIKKTQYFKQFESFDADQFDHFIIDGVEGFEENAILAKLSLEQVMKLSQVQQVDPEMLQQATDLLAHLSGVELALEDDSINDDNWENEIEE